MSLIAHQREVADLEWYWNDSAGEMQALRSTWTESLLASSGRSGAMIGTSEDGGVTEDVGLRCGPVYVPKGGSPGTGREMDHAALHAATRERCIRTAIHAAGLQVELVLRLRFREPLPQCRVPFGLAGEVAPRRGRLMTEAMGVRLTPARGPGSLAHLTPTARSSSTVADVARWANELGARLAHGKASAEDRDLQRAIARECEALELEAIQRYRAGIVRVPERVRRQARERDAR